MSQFEWKSKGDGQERSLYLSNTLIGMIQPFVHPGIMARDELVPLENGLFSWTRHFQVNTSVPNARLLMDFTVPRQMTYGMIPAVSYNGNPWEPGHDIKGFVSEGQPWTFAYHRTAVAGGTYSENADWSVALFAKEGFTGACALIPFTHQTVHRLVWPEIETPHVYTYRDEFSPPYETNLLLEANSTVSIHTFLLVTQCSGQPPRTGWRAMLDTAWQQHQSRPQPRYSNAEVWEWGIRYAKESLWAEEGVFRGFSIGLQWRDGSWRQRTPGLYEIGWCGQNASLANALLHDYLINGDRSSLEKGLTSLDCWAKYGPLPNGLFRCHFNRILAGEALDQEVQDGCNLGAAALYFFEAFELSTRCEVSRPVYREVALKICDFFVAHQFEDGNLGRAWRGDGTCVATDGATGGFLIPPLLTAYQITGEEKYLQTAKQALNYYMKGLLENGFSAAGALDTYCIDKESAIPLLRGGIKLYKLSGEPQYLEWAEQAAYYLSSWQWHHTVGYPPGTALNALGYDTFGGTSVSTQHHHQDAYALTYVPSLIKLAAITGNHLWKERGQAIWANGMIGVSDGNLMVLGKSRPVGSQDEGFFHTRWGHPPFSTSEWLVAWPTAFRLEVLRSLSWSELD